MKPAPWCFNGHAHTILPSLLFDSPVLGSEKEIVHTPDGDFIETDVLDAGKSRPVVLLFHGLEGNSRRYYITKMAQHLYHRNFSVIAVNFRSCGSMLNLRRRFYHSGETKDLETVFKWTEQLFPGLPVFAAGFSLGASALLNFLKKHGTHHPLKATAAISTPFNLKEGSLNLDKGFNRIYSKRFLITLVQKLEKKREKYPDLPQFTGSTIYEFDDQVTGPIHGFAGADDYYFNCSSAFFMDKIHTNSLIIHSKDDPLCPFPFTPVQAIKTNPKTTAIYTSQGGHVGFWSLPPGWINKTVGDYFEQFL